MSLGHNYNDERIYGPQGPYNSWDEPSKLGLAMRHLRLANHETMEQRVEKASRLDALFDGFRIKWEAEREADAMR